MSSSVFVFLAMFLIATNAAPQISVGPEGVGVNFGGYHASAGLGGLLGGNGPSGGLFAQAGTPNGHGAFAGLGGSAGPGRPQGSVFSGTTRPGSSYPVQPSQGSYQPAGGFVPQGSKYNDIFNIPISALQAVNQYLNNRNAIAVVPARPVYILGRSNSQSTSQAESFGKSDPLPSSLSSSSASSSASSSSSSSSSNASSSASSKASATASANAGSSSTGYSNAGAPVQPADARGYVVNSSPTKFDRIFDIPITVLKSVNNLLNG